MKLCDAISRYITYKQGVGMIFQTEATILRAFMEKVGRNVPVAKIDSQSALQYLNGRGPLTLFWHRKHDALSGFWRFAIQHSWTDRSPLPARRPKEPVSFIPYIYSREELKRLLEGDINVPTQVAQAGTSRFPGHPLINVWRGSSHR